MRYCQECGTALVEKELEHEGMIPFCPNCREYRFPTYHVAVCMIIVNLQNGRTLLVKQYGRDYFRLVAGYVNRMETLEHALARELKEETGMTAVSSVFNRTRFYEVSNTLMCNFTVFVKDDSALQPNYEIDSWAWFSFEEARAQLDPGSLAGGFMNAYLDAQDPNASRAEKQADSETGEEAFQ